MGDREGRGHRPPTQKVRKPICCSPHEIRGITLNQLIFLGMLVLIPAIQLLWQRSVFVAGVMFLSLSLIWLHKRFLPTLPSICPKQNRTPSLGFGEHPIVARYREHSRSPASWLYTRLAAP